MVGEIHLAGHSEQRDDENALLLIDSHDRAIADPVWTLYQEVVSRIGSVPTLIEWDSQIPDWYMLQEQARIAHQVMTSNEMHEASPAQGVSHAV
jgi:uncharacterized protein (UPF0276 family)